MTEKRKRSPNMNDSPIPNLEDGNEELNSMLESDLESSSHPVPDSEYMAPEFVGNRAIEMMHSMPRLGHVDNIAYASSANEQVEQEYFSGVISLSLFTFLIFVVWVTIMGFLRCLGPNRVGCASGLRSKGSEDMESLGGVMAMEWEGRRLRRVRIVFLVCCLVLMAATVTLVGWGLMPLKDAYFDIQDTNHNLQTTLSTTEYYSRQLVLLSDAAMGLRDEALYSATHSFCPPLENAFISPNASTAVQSSHHLFPTDVVIPEKLHVSASIVMVPADDLITNNTPPTTPPPTIQQELNTTTTVTRDDLTNDNPSNTTLPSDTTNDTTTNNTTNDNTLLIKTSYTQPEQTLINYTNTLISSLSLSNTLEIQGYNAALSQSINHALTSSQTVDDTMTSLSWWFYASVSIAFLLDIFALFFIIMLFSVWSNKCLVVARRGNAVLFPVFVLLIFLMWCFTIVFVATVVLSADVCTGSPENNLMAVLDERAENMDILSFYLVEYYIKDCTSGIFNQKPTQYLDDLLLILDQGIDVSRSFPNWIRDSFTEFTFSDMCSAVSYTPFLTQLESLTQNLEEVRSTLSDLIQSLYCEVYNPMYIQIMHQDVCYDGVPALMVIFISLTFIIFCGMVMVSLRVALKAPPILKREERFEEEEVEPIMEGPNKNNEEVFADVHDTVHWESNEKNRKLTTVCI